MKDDEKDGGVPAGQLLVRAFVAIRLDDKVRGAIESAIARLRACPARVSWVPGENLHLSVIFLGNVPKTMIGQIAGALDGAVAGIGPFAAQVGGLGTFGKRVVWAGVKAPPALADFHGRLVAGLARLGVRVEDRPYTPHITLGRIKHGSADLARELRGFGNPDFGTLAVGEAALMRSELRPEHAVYAPLHVAKL